VTGRLRLTSQSPSTASPTSTSGTAVAAISAVHVASGDTVSAGKAVAPGSAGTTPPGGPAAATSTSQGATFAAGAARAARATGSTVAAGGTRCARSRSRAACSPVTTCTAVPTVTEEPPIAAGTAGRPCPSVARQESVPGRRAPAAVTAIATDGRPRPGHTVRTLHGAAAAFAAAPAGTVVASVPAVGSDPEHRTAGSRKPVRAATTITGDPAFPTPA
ncbi:hypothetical protein AO501_30870, partial [Mycobacterium gordonae]